MVQLCLRSCENHSEERPRGTLLRATENLQLRIGPAGGLQFLHLREGLAHEGTVKPTITVDAPAGDRKDGGGELLVDEIEPRGHSL